MAFPRLALFSTTVAAGRRNVSGFPKTCICADGLSPTKAPIPLPFCRGPAFALHWRERKRDFMAEETTAKELAGTPLPETQPAVTEPGPATTEAIRRAPRVIRRSMPMALPVGLGILLAALVGWFFYSLMWFLLVLYLSFVAATILEAPVQWVKRRGIRRGMAAVLVMVGSLVVVGGMGYLLTFGIYNQITAVSSNLEKAPERINNFVNGVRHHLAHSSKRPSAAAGPATQADLTTAAEPSPLPLPAAGGPTAATAAAPASQPLATAPASHPADFDISEELARNMPTISTLWANAMWGVEGISWLVIMFFIVLYMLVDGADHLKGMRRLIPKHARLEATRLFNELAQAHRGWALASLSNVASSTIMTGLGLYLLGVPGAFILGFFAGLGELIPNIGPLLGALPALLLTLLGEPDKFFYVVGMFIIVQTIQSYTISPMMLKFSVELPVLVTIISVLVFGMLFGFLGILVAIPLVADMVVVWSYLNRYMEKDTEDYDAVNLPAAGPRVPMSPDNTSPSRLRKIFRRSISRPNAAEAPRPSQPAAPAPPAGEAAGMDKLDQAERRSSTTSPP
jgi:predicted PurR-regulated permease PerM